MSGKKSRGGSSIAYSVHPAIAYTQSIIRNMPRTTGKSIDEWSRLLEKSAPTDDAERREWLKIEHKLGGTTAWLIVDHASGRSDENMDPNAYLRQAPRYVEEMYAGPKAALRPIHDALIKMGLALGNDVKVCPCKTMVPLYRNHVFAQVKPSTQKRIDFGLSLKGVSRKHSKRLIDTGGLKTADRITHRFPITTLNEVDDEVARWTRVSYDLDVDK